MLQISKVLCAYVFTCSLYAQDSIKSAQAIKSVFSIVNLTDDELNDEDGEVANISGIFSASDDIYLNTIGFEFQGVYYNARGLDASHITFLLNGVNQNRLYNGRPAWNNWGGVDGIYSTQELIAPLGISEKTFGNALGVISLSTRPSKYRLGTRVRFATSNRSYQYKTSINHVGHFSKSWYYSISASRRWGDQGFREGTFYDANSLMLSLEKYFKKHHSLTASFLYTPNRRGVASSYTDEVFNLRGYSYNGNWGYQNGEKRNARVRNVKEPLFLITHSYTKSDALKWQSTLFLQKGTSGYSRIDYNGGRNPGPVYYQNLPSYWLSRNRVDYENVYRYQQEFLNNGQLNWEALYSANAELKAGNKNGAYVLYDDKRDESRVQFNSNVNKKLNENWSLSASVNYRKTLSDNYAEVLDLFGGNGYLDVASFTQAQSDVNKLDRVVFKGDRFKYNYKVNSTQINGFIQTQWKGKRLELIQAIDVSNTSHQRKGLYRYENQINSEGKSEKLKLSALQGKLNALYKFSGRSLVDFKITYIEQTPTVQKLFPNARVSNTVLKNIETENLFSNSLSYIYRGLKSNLKLTGYYNIQRNVTETGFYFAEGFGTDADDVSTNLGVLLDENSLFVQEVLNNIRKKHVGLEFGASYDLSSSTKLTGVVGIGEYTYDNNPNLLLYTENDAVARSLGFVNGEKDLGKANVKGRKLSSGPQQAFSIKLTYNDPNYWRLKLSVNHFRNNYVDIAPIKYTSNFTQEINGDPIHNIDRNLVSLFRKQEQLKNFTLVNMSGGKSWKLKNSYLSLYWILQNVLDVEYKTGGFTSSRPANYSEQLKEHNREQSLFGNRYFVGNGRTFFTGIYYSF